MDENGMFEMNTSIRGWCMKTPLKMFSSNECESLALDVYTYALYIYLYCIIWTCVALQMEF